MRGLEPHPCVTASPLSLEERRLRAAGGGWLAVSYFGGGMTALAAMVCASLVSYALICVIVMGSRAVWRVQKA